MVSKPTHSARWLVLAIVSCSRIGVGFQFIILAALILEFKADLHFGYTEIGILLGTFMAVGVFLSLPSRVISTYLGDRRTLQVGLVTLTLGGLVLGTSDGFAMALAGRLLGGVGAAFITVTAAKLLTDWFDGKEIATAMSVMGVTWPLGIALGMSLLPFVNAKFGWQTAIFLTSALPAAALFFTTLLPRLPTPADSKALAAAARMPFWSIQPRELLALFVAAFAWSLMSSGGYVVFSAYAPGLLIEQGISQTSAGLTISLLSWSIIVTIPLGGYLADRTGKNDLIFWGACIAAAAAIAMTPLAGPIALWIVFAAVLGLAVGPVMALPAEILSPANRNTGIGFYYSVYYLGTGGLPALAGWILSATGSVTIVIWFSALCLGLAPLCLLAVRTIRIRRRPDSAHEPV